MHTHTHSHTHTHTHTFTQIGVVFSDHDPLANPPRCRLIVFELIKGGELHDYLERRQHRATEIEEVTDMLRFTHMLASGLAYIHGRGILHCDLAARNVMVSAVELVGLTIINSGRLSWLIGCM